MVELAENRPKWVQVKEILAARIEDETYPIGTRVPSVVQLVAEFDISNVTAQKVLKALREQGLIETVFGMGSFVAKR
jgi:GntR family transcriptional regulator